MEAPEEVAAAQIVKGKRTKRQRVESPLIPLALTTTNSSSGEDCNMNVKNSPSWSPTSSNVDEFHQDSTEEEDMANCLILLAQGRSRDTSRQDDEDNDTGVYYNNNSNSNNNSQIKFNSRRFLETASSTGSGKVGYYVYECKTCNRTFPSFQALGGHRASHKKPKAVAAAATAAAQKDYANKKHMMMMMMMNNNLSSDEEEGNYKNISSLSLQLSNNNNDNINNRGGEGGGGGYNKQSSKAKIHECSICGAEFTSGQALGGHMRRHRAPVGSSSTALSLTPLAVEYVEEAKKARNNNNYNNNNNGISLDLDLNLPAPEDDKFSFASKQQHQQQQQQQQEKVPIVFSSRSLVDCHY